MSTATVTARASRSEWSRIWSVRSSWAFAGVTTVAVVGLGTILGIDVANGGPGGPSDGSTAWDGGRFTAMFALFGMVAMAVVTATADHGSGGIVPTLQWTPRRGVLLTARTAVIALTTTMVALLAVTGASTVVWLFAPELGLPLDSGLSTLGDVAVVVGCGSLLGIGLGLLTRSTAAGLVAAIALVLLGPLLIAQLPYAWATTVSAHLPGSGAVFLVFGEGPLDDMTALRARVTLLVWAVGAVAAGGWRLLRSDATR